MLYFPVFQNLEKSHIIKPAHEIMALFVLRNSFFKRACAAIQRG